MLIAPKPWLTLQFAHRVPTGITAENPACRMTESSGQLLQFCVVISGQTPNSRPAPAIPSPEHNLDLRVAAFSSRPSFPLGDIQTVPRLAASKDSGLHYWPPHALRGKSVGAGVLLFSRYQSRRPAYPLGDGEKRERKWGDACN